MITVSAVATSTCENVSIAFGHSPTSPTTKSISAAIAARRRPLSRNAIATSPASVDRPGRLDEEGAQRLDPVLHDEVAGRVRQVAEQERARVLDVVEPALHVVRSQSCAVQRDQTVPASKTWREHGRQHDGHRAERRCTRAGRAPCARVRCRCAGSVRFAIASVARSSAIAMITIAAPAKIAKTGSV